MSSSPKNDGYFYVGIDHGLPILMLIFLIITVTTLIGTIVLLLNYS